MQTVLVVVHVFLSIGLIVLILMQHGKGADAGAAFGSGASATVFGAQGSANFLSRTTAILAALFFVTSLGLAWLAMRTEAPKGIMEALKQEGAGAQVTPKVPQPASEVPLLPAAPVLKEEAPKGEVPVVEEKPAEPLAPVDPAASAVVPATSPAEAAPVEGGQAPAADKTAENPVVPQQ